MKGQPRDDRPLYEQVAERLRSRILSHTLSPGSWIDEQRLCGDYGISRTPLREALKVLATEGLVTMKPRRGAYVTEMSERDVIEVYHLLSLLESDAAGEVARHASRQRHGQNWRACMSSWKAPPRIASGSSR